MDSGRPVPAHASGGGVSHYSADQRPRCPATATRAERREMHRQKMALKRQQLMQPGFMPVRNRAIADAVQALMLLVKLENPNLSPVEVEEIAIGRVARKLPMPSIGYRSWRNRPPTKNANPEYRK